MGDVAGVGPEIVARVIATHEFKNTCDFVVVGDPGILARALRLIGAQSEVFEIARAVETAPAGTMACWNPGGHSLSDVTPGMVNACAGAAVCDWLVAAGRAALAGEVDAVVTAPLNKAGLRLAGRSEPGHTEILANLSGVNEFGMMLYVPPGPAVRAPAGLGIIHETLHTALRDAPRLISERGIVEKARLLGRFLRGLGVERPRLGVCALNPHSGEGGLFGDEETRVIAPAVERARSPEIEIAGPFPADTLIRRAVHGEFDGVVAMYHDQGHIPIKLIAFDSAVNITLGLPFVRTSPSHGTAYDIAWTGAANPAGMWGAVRAALGCLRAGNRD